MTLFKRFARLFKSAPAFAVMATVLGGGVFMNPTVTRAEVADPFDQADFSDYRFVPGVKWYALNKEIPASVVKDAEAKLGAPFCKIQIRPGVWISNLKICPEKHPQMSDPQYGILNPMLDTGNKVGDYITQNYAYDMPPRRADLKTAKVIKEEFQRYTAEAEAAAKRTRIATGKPVQLSGAVKVADAKPKRVAPPVELAQADIRKTPVPRPAPRDRVIAEPAADTVVADKDIPTAPIILANNETRPAPFFAPVLDNKILDSQPVPASLAFADAKIVPVVAAEADAPVVVASVAYTSPAATEVDNVSDNEKLAAVLAIATATFTAAAVVPVLARKGSLRSRTLQGRPAGTGPNEGFNRVAAIPSNPTIRPSRKNPPSLSNEWRMANGQALEFYVNSKGRYAPAPRLAAA